MADQKVTDPALLAELDKPVDDPALLAELNGSGGQSAPAAPSAPTFSPGTGRALVDYYTKLLERRPVVPPMEATVRAGLRGFTGGFSEKGAAALDAGTEGLRNKAKQFIDTKFRGYNYLPEEPEGSFDERYKRKLDEIRKRTDQAYEDQPAYTLPAEMLGTIARDTALASTGAGLAPVLASSALTDIAGRSDNLSDVPGNLKYGIPLLSYGGAKALGGAQKLPGVIQRIAKETARANALRAAGIDKARDADILSQLGRDPDRMNQAADELLKMDEFSPFSTKKTIQEALMSKADAGKRRLNNLLGFGDEAAKNASQVTDVVPDVTEQLPLGNTVRSVAEEPTIKAGSEATAAWSPAAKAKAAAKAATAADSGGPVSAPVLAFQLRKKVLGPLQDSIFPEDRVVGQQVEQLINNLEEKYGQGTLSLREAHEIEKQLGDQAFGTAGIKSAAGAKAKAAARSVVSNAVDEGMTGAGFGPDWLATNKEAGPIIDLEEILRRKMPQDQLMTPKAKFGLKSLAAAAAGGAVGGPLGAIGAEGAYQLGHAFGPQATASLANKLANALPESAPEWPKLIAGAGPEASTITAKGFNRIGERFAQAGKATAAEKNYEAEFGKDPDTANLTREALSNTQGPDREKLANKLRGMTPEQMREAILSLKAWE